jgi:hypothetical protein
MRIIFPFHKSSENNTRYKFRDGYIGSIYHTETQEVIVHPKGNYWAIPLHRFHLPLGLGRKPTGKLTLEEGIPLINTSNLIVTEDKNKKITIVKNPKLMTLDQLSLKC